MAKGRRSKPSAVAASNSSGTSTAVNDVDRTVEDWKSLNQRTLALKCSQLQLDAKGRKDVLAARLHRHLHPNDYENDENVAPPGSSTSQNLLAFAPTTQSNGQAVSPATHHQQGSTTQAQLLLQRQDQLQQQLQQPLQQLQQQPGQLPLQLQQQPGQQPLQLQQLQNPLQQQQHQPSVQQHPLQQQTRQPNADSAETTRILCEAIATLQEQQKLQEQQQRSLQSSIQLISQGGQTAQGSSQTIDTNTQFAIPLTVNNPTETNNLMSYNPHLTTTQQVSQQHTLPQAQQQQPGVHFQIDPAVNTGALSLAHGFNNHQLLNAQSYPGTSHVPPPSNNPYLPPVISSTLMKQIKNGEYIDFGALLFPIIPTAASMASIAEGEDSEEYCLSQRQEPGSSARFIKKSARSPITNYATWVLAWNMFYEATLHHFPLMHYELFSYFKHIAEYAVTGNLSTWPHTTKLTGCT